LASRKLTPELAAGIRLQYKFGAGVRQLAREYGMAHSAVSRLVRGITYPDAGGPVAAKKPRFKLNDAVALEIRLERARTFATIAELGVKYGVSDSEISLILRGIAYPRAGGPILKAWRPHILPQDS
jgi:hypothetical protein